MRRKRNKVSHIHITDKKTNFARVNKFYNQNNPLLRSEGNRTNFLKPISTKTNCQKRSVLIRGYSSKKPSQDLLRSKTDSAYANSSASTQISWYGRLSSENRMLNVTKNTRTSFKEQSFKNAKLSIIKDDPESEFLLKQIKRKTTMESKRLRSLRLNKLSK
mmetsp:Transcript_26994/g.23831  ORF Transcript_26994/g.23831 Transcript_26994/m.23831 type:complete len:161 (-) Transcript_26994:71-553(-)